MTPRFGLITTVYNHADYLWDCFYSVLAQRYTNFIHVIVNDASPDHAKDRIAEYLQKRPSAIVVNMPINVGPAAAFNAGVRAMPPGIEWIMKCDADDKIDARLIEDVMEVEREDSTINVVVPPARHFGNLHTTYTYPRFDPHRMIQVCMIPGQAAYRRFLWDIVGGYDETMRSAEDWDFFIRAQYVVGLEVRQLSAPRWCYRMHDGPRASTEGMSKLHILQEYWRGFNESNSRTGQRSFATWLANRNPLPEAL